MKNVANIFEKMGFIEKIEENEVKEVKEVKEVNEVKEVKPNIEKEEKQEVSNKLEKEALPKNNIEVHNNNTPNEKFVLEKIESIYAKNNVYSEGVNSVFIIENFAKALPNNLPINMKRDSVLNIVSCSGMLLDKLISDGQNKLKCINQYRSVFNKDIEFEMSKYEEQIKEQEEKIVKMKKLINELKELKKDQLTILDYEEEQINSILNFIKQ